MKLIIQIPCYNEAETLAVTLSVLPRKVPGFDKVEWLVIDDGSTDNTIEIALKNGVNHIVQHIRNRGLARAFMTGIREAVRLGADVIVNTDADNQYNADDIPVLVNPIIEKKADIVIGARPIDSIRHFSQTKKILQKIGSWVVRTASNTDIPDAASGFRAMSRDAVQRLIVFDNYTYTLETIIQAGQKNMAITSVPIRVNADLRPSRLVKNNAYYVIRSIFTIVRMFIVYRPFRFFCSIGVLLLGGGILIGIRFMWFYFTGHGDGHVQSLILSGILAGMGFQTLLIAVMADLLSVNRTMMEDVRYNLKIISHDIENIKLKSQK